MIAPSLLWSHSMQRGCRLEHAQEALRRQGFGTMRVETSGLGTHLVFARSKSRTGHQQHVRSQWVGPQAASQLKTIEAGHLDVEQNRERLPLTGHAAHGERIAQRTTLKAVGVQQHLQRFGRFAVIVDHQHPTV